MADHKNYAILIRSDGKPYGYIHAGNGIAYLGESHSPLLFDSRIGAEIVSARWEEFANKYPDKKLTVHVVHHTYRSK